MADARRLKLVGVSIAVIVAAALVATTYLGDTPVSRSFTVEDCEGLRDMDVAGTELCTHGHDHALIDVASSAARPLTEASNMLAKLPDGPVVRPTEVPCYGTGTDGRRVQAIYAFAPDRPDDYERALPLIRFWAWAMDTQFNRSANATGGVRHIRWVTDPECILDVERVTLSKTGDDSFTNLITELVAKGYERADRRYLIWLQSYPESTTPMCVATARADDSPGPQNVQTGATGLSGYASVGGFIETTEQGLDQGGGCWQFIETHELLHSLGAVQLSAPHSSDGPHCWDGTDPICGGSGYQPDVCSSEWDGTGLPPLDCNKDDYFNTDPAPDNYLATHWNVADSPFLSSDAPSNLVEAFAADGTACTIIGTEGDDRLRGTYGPDVICGLGGNDVITPHLGRDIVDGGPGLDTLSFPTFGRDLKIDLAVSMVKGLQQGVVISLNEKAPVGDKTLFGLENTTGTIGNDQIFGSKGPNVLEGGGGNDRISGRGGDDRLLGGDDRDELRGGGGNDQLDAGAGSGDELNGDKGRDHCVRSNSADQYVYGCES